MTKVAIVYYSGFKGVTEKIAEAVAQGARQVPETQVITIHTDSVDNHWQDLGEADAIIFGTPTYIGGPAAKFKEFIEKLAGDIWLQRLWLNKISGGFTVSAGRSGDKQSCLQQLATYAAQMGMLWVPVRITGGNYSSQGSEDDLNRMAGYLGVMAQATSIKTSAMCHHPATFRQRRCTDTISPALRDNTGWEDSNYPPITTSHWIAAVPQKSPRCWEIW